MKSQQIHESETLYKKPKWACTLDTSMDIYSVIYLIAIFLIWHRRETLKKGKPWFSWGARKTTVRYRARGRLRTHSIRHRTPARKARNADMTNAWARLNSLTHSPDMTRRLVENLMNKHSHRGELWCIEKAIYDIQRDRMGRH